MTAVLQLNEVGLGIVLRAKEYFCDLVLITDATFVWTFVSAEAYAGVAAAQHFGTGLCAWRAVTRFVAKLAATLVQTLPGARLCARGTGLSTTFLALAVDADVLAGQLAWRALTGARFPALMGTNEQTFTLVGAWEMIAPLVAFVASTSTAVAAFQL